MPEIVPDTIVPDPLGPSRNPEMPDTVELLDRTLDTPEENLAFDEVLFVERENRGGSGILRLWEPDRNFVVVGYTNVVGLEVRESVCRALGVSIFRRCTGGGAVVQMPGCLNYTLVLPLSRTPRFRTIASTNHTVMTVLRDALQPMKRQAFISVGGISDLTLDGRKFSGNAQRRGRRYLLFHGVILNSANLEMIPRVLPMPSRQPAYRLNRSHNDFLTNLEVPLFDLKHALATAWNAVPAENATPRPEIERLAASKYKQESWIFKR
jgi:lipoate-protein ligase A